MNRSKKFFTASPQRCKDVLRGLREFSNPSRKLSLSLQYRLFAGGEIFVLLVNHPGGAKKISPAAAGRRSSILTHAELASDLLDVNRRANAGKPYPVIPVFMSGQGFVELAGRDSAGIALSAAKQLRGSNVYFVCNPIDALRGDEVAS